MAIRALYMRHTSWSLAAQGCIRNRDRNTRQEEGITISHMPGYTPLKVRYSELELQVSSLQA